MTTKPKPASPPDWRQRERTLLDRRRQISADIGALEAGRIRLQVAMAGVDDPTEAEAALAKFRVHAADLRASGEDVEAALAVVAEHRAAEDATERAREREVKRVAMGLLLDRRAGCAATFDALLAAAEVAFAELRETAPAITHLAYEIDLGELPGLSEPAETAAVQAAVCACAPTLARILGIHTMAYEPGQRHSLGSTEAWRSTAIDRRVVDGREKDQAARKRLERQAEHTAAIRTARAEAASVEAARANAARA